MLNVFQLKCLLHRFTARDGYCACEPVLLVYDRNNLDDYGYCSTLFCDSCRASKIKNLIDVLEGWE